MAVVFSVALGLGACASAGPPHVAPPSPLERPEAVGAFGWFDADDPLTLVIPAHPWVKVLLGTPPLIAACGRIRSHSTDYIGQYLRWIDWPGAPLRTRLFGSPAEGAWAEVWWPDAPVEPPARSQGRLVRWDAAGRVAGVEVLRGGVWEPVLSCGPVEGGWGCEGVPGGEGAAVSLIATAADDASGPRDEVVASIQGFANRPTRRLRYGARGQLLEVRVEGEGEVTAQRTHHLEYDEAGQLTAVRQRYDWPGSADEVTDMRAPPTDSDGRILPARQSISAQTFERFESLRERGNKRVDLSRDGAGVLAAMTVTWPAARSGCPFWGDDSIPRYAVMSPVEVELCRSAGPHPGRDIFTREEFLGMRRVHSGSAPLEVARQAAGSFFIEASGSGGRGAMRWRVTFEPSTVYRVEYLNARQAMIFRESHSGDRVFSSLGFVVELPSGDGQRDLRIVDTIGWGGFAPLPHDDDAVARVLQGLLEARAGWPEALADPESEAFEDERSRVVVTRGKARWRRLDAGGRVVAFAEGSSARWERVFFGAACDSWPNHEVPPIHTQAGDGGS